MVLMARASVSLWVNVVMLVWGSAVIWASVML